METYSIKDVEKLTGIKAHTLRIWEKRYSKLLPHRNASQTRYYDDEQVRKLLNVSTLLKQGHKISSVLNYPDEKVNEMILEFANKATNEELYNTYIKRLITAMISFDEAIFDKIFSSIFIRFGVADSMLKIVYPFLRLTGVMWGTNNIVPIHEHFASNIVKRKLYTVIDGIPVPINKNKKFLLFLPSDEWHEIGLLFAEYIIRNSGFETVYLGQNMPKSNMILAIEKLKPTHLFTLVTINKDTTSFVKYFEEIANRNLNINILIGTSTNLGYANLPTNVFILDEPTRIFDFV